MNIKDIISTFSAKQLDTYNRIQDLEIQMQKSVNPAVFTLNDDTLKIAKEIENTQNNCDHIWDESGICCVICGGIKH